MDESKLKSMVRLLDDPDNSIYQTVLSNILKQGKDALPVLEDFLSYEIDSLHRNRITDAIHEIQIRQLRNDLKMWTQTEPNPILHGAWLVNKIQYPKITFETVDNEVSAIANRIRERLNPYLSGLQQIRIFNDLLYRNEQFQGNIKDIMNPQNAFLTDMFVEKKGNDISMAILYVSIAEKIGLPLRFVNFPRNVLLAFIDTRNVSEEIREKDVVFYVNPFNNGAVVTISDINSFLKLHSIKPEQSHYVPCSNSIIIKRLITALVASYEKLGYADKVKTMQRLLKEIK